MKKQTAYTVTASRADTQEKKIAVNSLQVLAQLVGKLTTEGYSVTVENHLLNRLTVIK